MAMGKSGLEAGWGRGHLCSSSFNPTTLRPLSASPHYHSHSQHPFHLAPKAMKNPGKQRKHKETRQNGRQPLAESPLQRASLSLSLGCPIEQRGGGPLFCPPRRGGFHNALLVLSQIPLTTQEIASLGISNTHHGSSKRKTTRRRRQGRKQKMNYDNKQGDESGKREERGEGGSVVK